MKYYQIKGWMENFENNKSRERDTCSYVCVPNKQHGMSFLRIMQQKDGAMIYGIWCLILGACSQQRKPRNGWLTHDGQQTGTPWAPSDLAMKWRRPEPEIVRSLVFLASPAIDWLLSFEVVEDQRSEIECPRSARVVPDECLLRKKERKNEGKKEDMSDAKACEILEYLNLKAERHFPQADGSLRHIRARLSEGNTPEQCLSVIDCMVAKWSSDPKMREFLRPSTLFNSEKFPNYLGMVGSKSFEKTETQPVFEVIQ
jgi:uncharacterized phage protein (TIGR02220 family)